MSSNEDWPLYIEDNIEDSVLYRVWTDSPDGFRMNDGFYEDPLGVPDLPEPYPFLVAELGPDFVEEHGPAYAANAQNYWELLIAANVDEVIWRENPRHIGSGRYWPQIFSEEVFDTMNRLAPGSFKSCHSFDAVAPGFNRRIRCHIVELTAQQNLNGIVRAQTVAGSFESDGAQFLSPSAFRKRDRLGQQQPRIEISLSDLPHGFLTIRDLGSARTYTTPGFIRDWLASEVSQNLRRAHFEDDFFFSRYEPFKGVFVHLV